MRESIDCDDAQKGEGGDVISIDVLVRSVGNSLPARLLAELRQRDEHYVGYYENEDRRSLIFVRPSYSETGALYHGGRSWERFQVVEGVVQQPVLKHAERAWLAACWHSSCRQRELSAQRKRASGLG